MSCLVDANVLSEATKPSPDPAVVDWLRRHEADVVVDPIILGEIRFGILLLPEGRRRRRLEAWFERVVEAIHCLDWSPEAGLRWARLLADLRSHGRSMPVKDSLIAATALLYDLPLATLNRRDFEAAGLDIIEPH